MDFNRLNDIPILDVAEALRINISNNKAFCVNPDHDDRNPSMSFNIRDNYFKCFACDVSGKNIKLVMLTLHCEYKEACNWLCDTFNLDEKRFYSKKTSIGKSTPKYNREKKENTKLDGRQFSLIYEWLIDKTGQIESNEAIDYLKDHAITDISVEKFNIRELKSPERAYKELLKNFSESIVRASGLINYSSLIWQSNTLLFPFYDDTGKHIVYIQGRQLKSTVKFKNLSNIEPILFNIQSLQKLKKGDKVYLCEGIPDALAVIGKGLTGIGVLGSSAFKSKWIPKFKNYDIYIIPDGDVAGDSFARKTTKLFREIGKPITVLSCPQGMDVASFIAGEMNE